MQLDTNKNPSGRPADYPFPIERDLESHRFSIEIAKEPKDVEAVLRLRYDVFKREMGCNPSESDNGLDQDQYDTYCDHLIVRDLDNNLIVGTYRLMRSDVAKQHCGFYSENEFDLSCLYRNDLRFVEVGRACIERNYRGQMIISLLWMGLNKYCEYHHIDYLGGCATVGRDPVLAGAIHHYAKEINALADPAVFPIKPNPQNKVTGLDLTKVPASLSAVKRELPPLLRAYFSIGAVLAPEPAYDPDFDVIDFFVLAQYDKNARRIMRFFGS